MANSFQICDVCKTTNVASLSKRIKNMDPDAEINIGCISYCGHCTKRAVLLVNGRYLTAPSEEEIAEKAKRFMKK